MNWRKIKLKYIARFAYGDALPKDEYREGFVKVFGSNGVYDKCSQANTQAPAIIVGRKGSYGKVNWSDESCFASDTTFFIDVTTTHHHLRWLFYVLQTLNLDQGTDETAVPGLNRDDAYGKEVFIPPLSEQKAIARYLDRQTAKIDELIKAKKRLLELLDEKRRALITHAVTRGLNPDVPMRDSGVEWIGEVPKHWGVEFAKWLFKQIDDRSITGQEELLTVSHITGVTPRSEKDVNMFMAESMEGYKVCQSGDLVINTLWAWMGAMGVSFKPGIVSPSYHVYRPMGKYHPVYLDYLVRIPIFAEEAIRYSKGVWISRLRLYPEEFFQILLPVPLFEEQEEIAKYLVEETQKLDNLGIATKKTIDLLQERRTALITAAVTGQLKIKE
ncbi:type I restriction-modification system S subunit [Planktothrix agardhii NIES-204]|jgi:type I restriction enzyme S subunit|nr:type I restriction-modification system S subunit [Planktothrix agardhii NIES-204]